jgi:hypothetical protein
MHAGRVFNRIEKVPLQWKFMGYTLGVFSTILGFVSLGVVLLLIQTTNLAVAILGGIVMLIIDATYIVINDRYVNPDLHYTEYDAWLRYFRRCRNKRTTNYR